MVRIVPIACPNCNSLLIRRAYFESKIIDKESDGAKIIGPIVTEEGITTAVKLKCGGCKETFKVEVA